MARINCELSDSFTRQAQDSETEILPPTSRGQGAGLEIDNPRSFGTHITATGDIQVQKDLSLGRR